MLCSPCLYIISTNSFVYRICVSFVSFASDANDLIWAWKWFPGILMRFETQCDSLTRLPSVPFSAFSHSIRSTSMRQRHSFAKHLSQIVYSISSSPYCVWSLFVRFGLYCCCCCCGPLPNYVFEYLPCQIPFNSNLRHITIYMYVMYKHFSIIV